MSARVGVAVAGAGMAGQAHAFGFRNATMHPGLAGVRVELAAVVDPNLALAESVAARYGFARAVADLDDVLGDPAIDAVSLALPNFAYADVIPRTLDAGKHVLAEKPLGRSADEAHGFAAAADAAGVVHAVDHSWLRAPAVEAIARIVEEGRIGRIRHASGWYLSDYAATRGRAALLALRRGARRRRGDHRPRRARDRHDGTGGRAVPPRARGRRPHAHRRAARARRPVGRARAAAR